MSYLGIFFNNIIYMHKLLKRIPLCNSIMAPPKKTTTASAPAATPVKKVVKSKSQTPVVETKTAVDNTVVEPAKVSVEENSLNDQFSEFMGKLQQFSTVFASLKNDFRALEKRCVREMKVAQKLSAKKTRAKGTRAPSGFVKPTPVSDALANFLGKSIGTEMARTEVTREINKYIRAHNLQDPQNGRKINPDSALASLLNIKKGEELTYFNLQRYMSPHFPKSGAAAAAAAASAASSA